MVWWVLGGSVFDFLSLLLLAFGSVCSVPWGGFIRCRFVHSFDGWSVFLFWCFRFLLFLWRILNEVSGVEGQEWGLGSADGAGFGWWNLEFLRRRQLRCRQPCCSWSV